MIIVRQTLKNKLVVQPFWKDWIIFCKASRTSLYVPVSLTSVPVEWWERNPPQLVTSYSATGIPCALSNELPAWQSLSWYVIYLTATVCSQWRRISVQIPQIIILCSYIDALLHTGFLSLHRAVRVSRDESKSWNELSDAFKFCQIDWIHGIPLIINVANCNYFLSTHLKILV